MKKFSLNMIVMVIGIFVLFGFTSYASAQAKKKATPANSKQAVSTVPPLPSTDAPPPANAVRGGTLKVIMPYFVKNLGYPPEMAPSDFIYTIPISERLVDWDAKGNLIPLLARSWEGDPVNKTVTYHLRKGVKFHDGTPFNAEAARWNFQFLKDNGRLTDGEFVKSIDVIDEHTVKLTCSEYTSQLILNYGWATMLSPTAFQKNGGKEWARFNAVGTGPFKQVEFKRDTVVRYEKNKEYWRKGYPLLDAIEMRWIPDPVTASMMIEKGEADAWSDVNNMKNVVDLEQKGLKVNWGPGMLWALMPANGKDPKSPYANKKVREALEYAIDKQAIAKTIGFGKFEPLTQIVPSASPAFNKGYNPRPYNPEKAKQLLAEAGYPNGFDTKLLALELNRDQAVAVQSYLNAVGIRVTVDLADMGRYFGALFGPEGWTDLAMAASGINPDATDLFVHFGPRPMTYRWGFIAKSPEFLALVDKALKTYEQPALNKVLQQAVKQAGEDAMVIPLWRAGQASVTHPWVHTDYPKIHSIVWYSHQDWLSKRK
jgi:peptide/nickel transport system substrate-binding protein